MIVKYRFLERYSRNNFKDKKTIGMFYSGFCDNNYNRTNYFTIRSLKEKCVAIPIECIIMKDVYFFLNNCLLGDLHRYNFELTSVREAIISDKDEEWIPDELLEERIRNENI